MAKRRGDYFGLGRLVSIILAIIPVTSWILGAITRFSEGKILAGILRLILGWNIIWIVDLILMILGGSILRLIPLYCGRRFRRNKETKSDPSGSLFSFSQARYSSARLKTAPVSTSFHRSFPSSSMR